MREFLSPADLSGAQILLTHELVEVVIVGKYEDFMSRAFEIVPPSLENLNDS